MRADIGQLVLKYPEPMVREKRRKSALPASRRQSACFWYCSEKMIIWCLVLCALRGLCVEGSDPELF